MLTFFFIFWSSCPRSWKAYEWTLMFILIWLADVNLIEAGCQGIEKGVSVSIPFIKSRTCTALVCLIFISNPDCALNSASRFPASKIPFSFCWHTFWKDVFQSPSPYANDEEKTNGLLFCQCTSGLWMRSLRVGRIMSFGIIVFANRCSESSFTAQRPHPPSSTSARQTRHLLETREIHRLILTVEGIWSSTLEQKGGKRTILHTKSDRFTKLNLPLP